MRLAAFIVALLLLAGTVAPTRGHLVLLAVFAGLAWLRPRPWRLFRPRPSADMRLAAFVVALLLLAGTVEPTRGWLIALSAVSGLALVAPRWCAVELPGADGRRWQRHSDRFGDGWS